MNFKRFIIGSLTSLIGISTVSMSFSFAWYASSNNLFIDTLVLDVATDMDFYISTSSELSSFNKTELDNNHLNKVKKFKPVSSMFRSTWEDNKEDKPIFYEHIPNLVKSDYTPYLEKANWGYFTQDLYFYTDANVYVTLDMTQFVVEENDGLNALAVERLHSKYPEYSPEQIEERLKTIKNCVRISILDPDSENYSYHIIDPYKTNEPVLLGGRQDLDKTKFYDYYSVYGSEEKYEIIYGEVNHRENAVYAPAEDDITTTTGELTSFNSQTDAHVQAFKRSESLANGLEIKEEETLSRGEVEDKIQIPVKAYTPKRFVLSIYMEGWDEDCINAHMGGSFNVNLKFKIARGWN
ncbi:MAG: hypothetical protein K6C32_04140 [Bacilli bacterium]|nr:hypothetical protein [Bacilli bacterium]